MEPPLDELLRRQYGIVAVRLEPGERGFVAHTWVVDTAAARFFAKLIPISRYTENIERALPVQQELYDSGIHEMNRPIPTLAGALSVRLERDILVVYDFIDGEWTDDFPFDAYVDLIARVHRTSVQTLPDVEVFEDSNLPELERVLAATSNGSFDDPSQLAVQEAIGRMLPEILADLGGYRRLMAELQSRRDVEMVITHHDGPGNILMDTSGRIFLVDWDDILLAPRERDTWFHLKTADDAARFLPLYRQRFPDYEPDERFYRFYLLMWYLEEIEGLVGPIVSPETTAEVRAKHLGYFRNAVPPLEAAVRRADERPMRRTRPAARRSRLGC